MRAGSRGQRPVGAIVLGTAIVLLTIVTAPQGEAQYAPRDLGPQPGSTTDGPPTEDCTGLPVVPIDLATALRLAQTSNLEIARARNLVDVTRAGLRRAQVQVLPNINMGSNYTKHDGNIAKTEGNIIKANKDALFVGLGPSVNFQTADALFGPLAARQIVVASEAAVARVTNDALLLVADAYFSVLRARRRLARVMETLDYLVSDRRTPGRADSKGLLPLIGDFVQVGAKEALRSELARVEVEVLRRQEEARAAVQDYRLASAELARLIRLDPETLLWPVEDPRFPVPIKGEQWLGQPVEDLVAYALGNRPELAENQALVQAAVARVRAAKFRPLLPNVALTYNWGAFGGGPDLNDPIRVGGKLVQPPGFGPSGRIRHMNTRDDLDVSLIWRLQNLGFGNRAEVREQKALFLDASLRRQQATDLVVTQVVQVTEAIAGWKQRTDIAYSSLFAPDGQMTGPVFRSLTLSFDRIKGGEGRPLEVLDSIRSLNDLLELYLQNMTDYERARFRLLVVLGLPPAALVDSVIHTSPPDCNGDDADGMLPAPRPLEP